GIQGQRELLAVPAFYHPGQPRCPAGAEIELAAPGSRLGRRFAVQIAKPLAQGIELLLQDRRPRPSHGGKRTLPSHYHAEAPQSQARCHRLAQMGKPLGDDIVPLVKSREAGHGSSPVSGNACHTSAYQNRASPFCCPEPRNLHLKAWGYPIILGGFAQGPRQQGPGAFLVIAYRARHEASTARSVYKLRARARPPSCVPAGKTIFRKCHTPKSNP